MRCTLRRFAGNRKDTETMTTAKTLKTVAAAVAFAFAAAVAIYAAGEYREHVHCHAHGGAMHCHPK